MDKGFIKMKHIIWFENIIFVLITVLHVFGQENNYVQNQDLLITHKEKLALENFKERMHDYLPYDYMSRFTYLIRWLRAKNLDITEAEKMLKKTLKWRTENRIDKILDEDFSEFIAHVDTYDKYGAPAITGVVEEWDFREKYKAGKFTRIHRFILKLFEEASLKVRHAQDEGKNVTRFHFLFNMNGFSLQKHGCPSCLATILNLIRDFENNYPGMLDKVVVFNAPPNVKSVRPVVRAAMSGRTRSHITFFERSQNEWKNFLLKYFDVEELTKDFGGTRDRL